MIRKFTLLFLGALSLFLKSQAQVCAFDQKHQQMLTSNTAYAQTVQQMNAKAAAVMAANPNALIVNTPNGPVYQIPVVIHVIHTGGAVGSNYNPDSAQLAGMIDYLNKSYAATWPSYPNVNTGGTYIPLQFALAKRTPQCTPTNGIIRVDGSSITGYAANGVSTDPGITPGADETLVKALSIWPNTEYYNVWVVNKIDGKDGITGSGSYTAGYAYFPGAPAGLDGTVMLASKAQAGEITLVHEIGHAFGLYHTFQGDGGGTACPSNNDCTQDGDRVCDTDPHRRSPFNCPAGTNPCTNQPYGDVVHNFMDYSNCQDRFTPGQKNRILNFLFNSGRASLLSSRGAVPVSGPSLIAFCPPSGITNTNSNSGIWGVEIKDAGTTYLSVESEGYLGDNNQFYLDRSCLHEIELISGNTYDFTVTTGPTAEKWKIFIDYDNDGIFQPGEEVQSYTGTNAYESHTFQFTVPGTSTVPGLLSCTPLRMRVISDRVSAPAIMPCGQLEYGQAEDFMVTIRGGGASIGAVSASLISGFNPSCFTTPLTFKATPAAGLTPAGFLWYVNGISTGITTDTFSSAAFNNNDVVRVTMYYSGVCGNDSTVSTGYLITRQAAVPANVSIAVTTGINPGCPGQMLSFTATPVNGGPSPVYQWKVNGNPVGTNSPVYSAVFNNNDVVTVDMISNSPCALPANATSPAVVVQHLLKVQDISIALTGGAIPSCQGRPLSFTASVVNGNQNVQYQWLVNGVPVPGANAGTFTSTTLADNDIVTAVSSFNDICILNTRDTSDPITIVMSPVDTPVVNIAITEGSNPGCLDSLIEFTATVSHHGAGPDYTWFVNGTQVATGTTYATSALLNGDIVVFRSAATDGLCYTSDTILTAPVVMVRNSTPAAPTISFVGNLLQSNVPNNNLWFGPNGVQIPGATGQTYHPTQQGEYFAVTDNGGCHSAPSNTLIVNLLNIATYDLSQLKAYPNPSRGQVMLDWGGHSVNVTIDVYSALGQKLVQESLKDGSKKLINMAHLANGNYFIIIRDTNGRMGTLSITLNK